MCGYFYMFLIFGSISCCLFILNFFIIEDSKKRGDERLDFIDLVVVGWNIAKYRIQTQIYLNLVLLTTKILFLNFKCLDFYLISIYSLFSINGS